MVDDDERARRARAAEAGARHRRIEVGADVVRRPAGPATPTVHAYLRHLRSQGLECVPEPLGIDGGFETLRLIEGESGGRAWWHQHDEGGLRSAAALLRRIHDAGAGWDPPAGGVWGADPVPGVDVVPNHGDPGPWNFVWREGVAVGLIDWDFLHPAPRLDDIAYALRWFVPLRRDEDALEWHHFPTVPDRRARARAFVDAYGDLPAFDVADAGIRSIRWVIENLQVLADAGVEPQRSWVADGAIEAERAEIDWIERRRDELEPSPSRGTPLDFG